jgi:hypothetical protein
MPYLLLPSLYPIAEEHNLMLTTHRIRHKDRWPLVQALSL